MSQATFNAIKYLGIVSLVLIKGRHSADLGVGGCKILSTDDHEILRRDKDMQHKEKKLKQNVNTKRKYEIIYSNTSTTLISNDLEPRTEHSSLVNG